MLPLNEKNKTKQKPKEINKAHFFLKPIIIQWNNLLNVITVY